jgi:hypothetical protein
MSSGSSCSRSSGCGGSRRIRRRVEGVVGVMIVVEVDGVAGITGEVEVAGVVGYSE